MARTLTRQARCYRVFHARRKGTGYGPWADYEVFAPSEVYLRCAPEVHRAKVHLKLPALNCHAWQWREHFGLDDMIYIAPAGSAQSLFVGYVADVDWGFSANDEHVTITAVSPAFRLRRLAVCGRLMMRSNGTEPINANGLRCDFNAGGKPNRSKSNAVVWVGTRQYSVPLFTFDGDPTAQLWRAHDIYEYLMFVYNDDEKYLANKDFAVTETQTESLKAPVYADVDGMSLWEALALIGDRCGADVYEKFTGATKWPFCALEITPRNSGASRTVRHQKHDDNDAPRMDLQKTTLFSASIAESVASCITTPIVAGGRTIFEITVPLGQAWDPNHLYLSESGIVEPGAENQEQDNDYVKRYCVGGDDFAEYADVGRLYDANSDGRYSDAPYSLDEVDVGYLCLGGTNYYRWPKMPYKPLPCVTRLGQQASGGKKAETYLEISFDGGSTWQPVDQAGYDVLPDRLGVYLTCKNLAEITAGNSEALEDCLFQRLVDDPSQVKMRLTCSVASPDRHVYLPARRTTAGTCFDNEQLFDFGSAGQKRSVSATSIFKGGQYETDEVSDKDAEAELKKFGDALQSAYEDRFIEASLPVEWPDEPVSLTDRITKIEGIEYPLGTNSGSAVRFPRVVGIDYHLTPETYSMTLILDTYRKAYI